MSFTVKANPRYEQANYEELLVAHPDGTRVDELRHVIDVDAMGFSVVTMPRPRRWEQPDDFYNKKPSIPPLLAVYEDGHMEEIW